MSSYLCRIGFLCGAFGLFGNFALGAGPGFGASAGVSVSVPNIAMKINGKITNNIGRASCRSTDPVVFDWPNNLSKDLRVLVFTAADKEKKSLSCPPNSNPNERAKTFVAQNPSVEQAYLLPDSACADAKKGESGKGILCFYPNEMRQTDLIAKTNIFHFDTRMPTVTKIIDRMAANNTAEFKIIANSPRGIQGYAVCRGTSDLPDREGACLETEGWVIETFTEPTITISNLDNNTQYAFKAQVISTDGTSSEWSKTIFMTPIPVAFILEAYDGKGADITWSCQSMATESGFFLLLLAVLLIFLRFARANTLIVMFIAIFSLALLQSKDAQAEVGQMNFGILGSMYRPDLDSEGGFPIYKCYFRKKPGDKDGPILPLMGLETDWHIYDGFGSLQLGVGLGYTLVAGKELGIGADGRPDCDQRTNIPVTLHMYQLRPQISYLFNEYVEYFPLFPYLRASFIGHGFYFKDGFKGARPGATVKNSGFRFGYQAALGLMLRLDFLEPGAVRDARNGQLFEHIYLKGELSYTEINLFNPGLNFSAKDIMGSTLPLMWTFGLVFELP